MPTGFLTELDSIIANAVWQVLRIPRNQGSRALIHAPTFMRGLRVKSMEDHYYEAVVSTCYKLLQSRDECVKEVIQIQELQVLEDTNTNMLELFEQPADHQPKVFFETRVNITFKVVDDKLGIKKAEWYLIPKDEMR